MSDLLCDCSFLVDLVCELKNPTMNQYLNALDNTGWLPHIKAVLEGAIFIARVREIRWEIQINFDFTSGD